MPEAFIQFPGVILAIGKLLLIALVGFALSRRGMLTPVIIRRMTRFLIWIALPTLILSRVTETFNPQAFPRWWLLPLSALLMSVLGFGIGFAAQSPFAFTARREFTASCAFQNCGYVPMSLIAFMSTGRVEEQLLTCIFLFLIGFNIGLWFFLPAYLSQPGSRASLSLSIVNVPFLAYVVAFGTTFITGPGWIPGKIVAVLRVIGNTSFPLSLIILGASLAATRGYTVKNWLPLAASVVTKLLVFPLLVLGVLFFIPVAGLDRFIIFLEATMPVAVTILLIGEYRGADNAFISGSILYSHLASMVTIPAWMYVYSRVF